MRKRYKSASAIRHDNPFDELVTYEYQQEWLNTSLENRLTQYVGENAELEEKYRAKCQKLFQREDFKQVVKPVLITYFKRCIISPAKTEISYWSLTCLTKAFDNTNHISLSRVNLNWLEVLTVWVDDNEEIVFSFHLTKSCLAGVDRKSVDIQSLCVSDHYYIPGGRDQFCISVRGLEDAQRLLNDDRVLVAIRTFNLQMMRKGRTTYGRYHCMDLAKLVLTSDSSR